MQNMMMPSRCGTLGPSGWKTAARKETGDACHDREHGEDRDGKPRDFRFGGQRRVGGYRGVISAGFCRCGGFGCLKHLLIVALMSGGWPLHDHAPGKNVRHLRSAG